MLIQCYRPGKCHNFIPGLSRFSRRFTNPQNIFVIVYHRSDRKGEKGWGHLHQATSTSKLYSGTVKIRRLEGGLGPMHYSRYISVFFFSCNWNDVNSQICKSRSISLPSCKFLIDPFQGNHISKQKTPSQEICSNDSISKKVCLECHKNFFCSVCWILTKATAMTKYIVLQLYHKASCYQACKQD